MAAYRRKDISLWCIVFLILNFASMCIAQATLYPYGSGESDSSVAKNNDFAVKVNLNRAFPYGKKYSSTLYVSTNGVLSFEGAVFEESDDPLYRNLPYYYDVDGDGTNLEQPDSILPFWADIDITTSGAGNIWYRESTQQSLLDQATDDVTNDFRSNPNFVAQTVIVVTWEQVTFFDQQGGSSVPTNTFQAVLITDGQQSFVYFMYENIVWTVGTRMGGDPATGLGDLGNALVGFLSNDGNTRSVLYNTQDADLALTQNSNLVVESPGVYAYKVDGEEAIGPSCQTGTDADFAITPTQSGMMGGELIYLLGPCWDSASTYTCVFSYMGTELQRVNATVVSVNDAYCVPDPFYLVGEVKITVEKDGATTTFASAYQLIENARVPQTVTRQDKSALKWETAENSLTVTWSSMGTSSVNISVLAYREDGSMGPRWDVVYEITNDTADDGSYTFTPTAQSDVTADNAFGAIRITSNSEERGEIKWSDIHSLGYILESSYQDHPDQWASDECSAWQEYDDAKGSYQSNIPACPCTYEQAVGDKAVFIADPTCVYGEITETCPMGSQAKGCFITAYATPDTSAGTRCCYDYDDLLIYSGDTNFAGMNSRSHIRGADPYLQQNLVPELSYWSNDLIAYTFCCEWGTDWDCFEYTQRRPTSDCVSYEPAVIALNYGDPHFITTDRRNYTYNGLGEYTLARYADDANGAYEFEVQVRLVQITDTSDDLVDVTQISAAAMADYDSDSIFVEATQSSGMNVYVYSEDIWTSVYFSQQTYSEMQVQLTGVVIGVTLFEREVEIYGLVVMFKTTGITVQIDYDYGMLSVQPFFPPTLNSVKMWGLLGNMDGDPDNDLKRRDNDVICSMDASEQDIFECGNTWEIEDDYSLFYYHPGKSHDSYQNSTYVPLMDVPVQTLYSGCEGLEACLFDYTVSGSDPDMAAATVGAYNDFVTSENTTAKIDSCPFIGTPYNGSKTYLTGTNRYFEGAEFEFECDAGLILTGSPYRSCDYDPVLDVLAWTGEGNTVTCTTSTCGHLATPKNGSITLSDDGQTATFTCDAGFQMDGASQSVCTNGKWNNSPPKCVVNGQSSGVNVMAVAVGVCVPVVVIIVVVIIAVCCAKHYQAGSTNLEKGPHVPKENGETNWGMDYDVNGAANLDKIDPENIPGNAPKPTSTGQSFSVVGVAVGVSVGVVVLILLIVLIVLCYNRHKNTGYKHPVHFSRNKKEPKKPSKSNQMTMDERDAELAEQAVPLNRNPNNDVRTDSRTMSSQSTNNTGPSAQIYKPTAISQSDKYNVGGDKAPPSIPPEPVAKDPEVPRVSPADTYPEVDQAEPALNLAVSTADEGPITPSETQTARAAPAPASAAPAPAQPLPYGHAVLGVVPRSKTPEPHQLSKQGHHASAMSGISHASNTSYATSVAPSTVSTRPRDDVTTVKGTGLLKDTNISGTGGWI